MLYYGKRNTVCHKSGEDCWRKRPVSLVLIHKLLKKFERTGSVSECKKKPSTPKLLSQEHLRFIDDALAEDDELAARRLKGLLVGILFKPTQFN